MDYKTKIPFFALLGISFAFIIIFLFADCLNYCAITCPRAQSTPIIDSNHQVYLLAGTAAIMGLLYGLIFGVMDVEDATMHRLAMLAMKDESYCYPIGIFIGFLAGLGNEFLREHGGQLPLDAVPNKFNQEI